MTSMIKVKVKDGSQMLLESKMLMLVPYAPGIKREFVLTDLLWMNESQLGFDQAKLRISVYYFTRFEEWEYYTEFQIFVLQGRKANSNELHLSGFVYQDDEDKPYRQGISDVFKMWEQEGKIEWFSLGLNSHLKADYIAACLFYGGIMDEMVPKEVYEIDWALIVEEYDFLFLASEVFFGERGYIGHDLFTFNDCLLTVFHKRGGYFVGIKLIFSNVSSIPQSILSVYIEIKEILLKYKFDLVEF